MAKKNYYAVKVGTKVGIYRTWDECSSYVNGYPGAKYKGFATLAEAEEYMGINPTIASKDNSIEEKIVEKKVTQKKSKAPTVTKKADDDKSTKEGYDVDPIKSTAKVKCSKSYIDPSIIDKNFEYIAFIDGSYDKHNKIYGSGVVVLDKDSDNHKTFYKSGYDKWDQWNIVGELEAAKLALKKAEELGVKNVAIYHDLKNISLWANGEWKAKNRYTQEYVRFIEEYSEKLNICFIKVKAHSNESIYNDLADEAAKLAIKNHLNLLT